jgi:hypothetical protein
MKFTAFYATALLSIAASAIPLDSLLPSGNGLVRRSQQGEPSSSAGSCPNYQFSDTFTAGTCTVQTESNVGGSTTIQVSTAQASQAASNLWTQVINNQEQNAQSALEYFDAGNNVEITAQVYMPPGLNSPVGTLQGLVNRLTPQGLSDALNQASARAVGQAESSFRIMDGSTVIALIGFWIWQK